MKGAVHSPNNLFIKINNLLDDTNAGFLFRLLKSDQTCCLGHVFAVYSNSQQVTAEEDKHGLSMEVETKQSQGSCSHF